MPLMPGKMKKKMFYMWKNCKAADVTSITEEMLKYTCDYVICLCMKIGSGLMYGGIVTAFINRMPRKVNVKFANLLGLLVC